MRQGEAATQASGAKLFPGHQRGLHRFWGQTLNQPPDRPGDLADQLILVARPDI